MTLPADVQRFLARHYSDAADLLDGEDLHGSMHASYGSRGVSFANCGQGVGWSEPDEPWNNGYHLADWPHQVRWTAVRAHVAAQPERLRDQLYEAREAVRWEYFAHHAAMDAINGREWYRGATDEQRAALDAEWRRYLDADVPLRAAVDAAVLALLPLATDEPADLIEWAAATETP